MIARAVCYLAVLVAILVGSIAPASATETAPTAGGSDNVRVELLTSRALVAPGETFYVALRQTIAPDWHTYWRNPGDSGEPTDITWTVSQGVTAGPIQWPAPKAIPFGPLVNYGYSGEVILPVAITVPKSAKVDSSIDLLAKVRWLECADICIPGEAEIAMTIGVSTGGLDYPDAQKLGLIRNTIAALPQKFSGAAKIIDDGNEKLRLEIAGISPKKKAYFFPYEIKNGALIDFAQSQGFFQTQAGFGLTLTKSTSFPIDLQGPVKGVLVLGSNDMMTDATAYEIEAGFEAAQAGTASTGSPQKSQPKPSSAASIGLIAALGMAFLGGLILNLMPCVFPILSMKALSLMQAAHGDTLAARAHGLWYGAGVMASFLALAAILIGAQSAGAALGWGFQLQNPAIVIGLAILMSVIGFNFLGFFEFGGSLQNLGGEKARSSFPTGVLAVVVAAPCTAPFMGAALGFAATQSAMVALCVFAALGLGFALPFVALTFAPALLRALPKPGAWMVRLREALAFPMFATAIWLIWVASAQAGQAGVLAALIGILGAGLGIWIIRTWSGAGGKALGAVTLIATLLWAGWHVSSAAAPTTKSASNAGFGEAWSQQRVGELNAAGKTVFVNFTADWCVTCKLNEVSVFSDARVKSALSGEKATYLVADWTLRDAKIAEALASHGRIGVPLYLVYKPGDSQPKILPQILTADVILEALK
jgi:thiol:disulfide interchange protein/DsbC/DsbD-like thiol-disulfide interchange protein